MVFLFKSFKGVVKVLVLPGKFKNFIVVLLYQDLKFFDRFIDLTFGLGDRFTCNGIFTRVWRIRRD